MPNTHISLKDERTVIKNLVEGKSRRMALEGTDIKSHNTVARIQQENASEIKQLRERYLAMIEKKVGMERRAELWGEMAEATKPFSSHTEPDRDIPDWLSREKALKYIDSLGGIAPKEDNEEQGNVIMVVVDVPRPENE